MIHRYIATRSIDLRIHIRSKSVTRLFRETYIKLLPFKAALILKPGHLIRNEAIDDE